MSFGGLGRFGRVQVGIEQWLDIMTDTGLRSSQPLALKDNSIRLGSL